MSDDLKGCVSKFLSEVEPCFSDSQKTSKYTIQNITENILRFACENEGDHIACKLMFVTQIISLMLRTQVCVQNTL